MYDIKFYEDKNGYSEVWEYIEKLNNSKVKADRIKSNKIRLYLKLLEEYGFKLNEPQAKKIEDEIWELRPLNDRFLFASWYENKIVILSHFVKTTNKTPRKEIEKARKLLKELKESD